MQMFRKKSFLSLLTIIALLLTFSSSAWANSNAATPISAKPGNKITIPGGKLTYATAVPWLVSELGLNIHKFDFIKKPEASDYFTNIPDDASYAEAFVIAHLNDLHIPQDVKPHDFVTREQLGHMIMQGIKFHGDFPMIKIFIVIADEEDITIDFQGSIQQLLVLKIAELDAKTQKFNPQKFVTRGVAATWISNAVDFIDQTFPLPGEGEEVPFPIADVKLTSETAVEGVLKVTVSGQAPHPGYGLVIESIAFQGDEAIVRVAPVFPDPDMMYPQVITEVSVDTYVSSDYKPVLELAAGYTANDSEASLDQSIEEQR